MDMDFQVGDRVRVIKDIRFPDKGMAVFSGTEGVIRNISGKAVYYDYDDSTISTTAPTVEYTYEIQFDFGYFKFSKSEMKMMEKVEESKMEFKEGDRVIKAEYYSENKYCRYDGGEESVPIGTRGTVVKVRKCRATGDDLIEVDFDNGVWWNVHPSELKTEKEECGNKNEMEESKMEKPETQLEKNALKEAKEKVIGAEIAKKAEDYKGAMQSFLTYEREARRYRKLADGLKETLGITDKEMKELF